MLHPAFSSIARRIEGKVCQVRTRLEINPTKSTTSPYLNPAIDSIQARSDYTLPGYIHEPRFAWIAAQLVAGRLFFAGEAVNCYGHQQTVYGAMKTAVGAAKGLLGIK
jgi:hypothetical protein